MKQHNTSLTHEAGGSAGGRAQFAVCLDVGRAAVCESREEGGEV